MTFRDAVINGFRNYADFNGRAARPEYWWFFLFILVSSIVLTSLDGLLGTRGLLWGLGLLQIAFNLAILVPALAVGARRLHDIGKPGWWLLVGIIPIIGGLVLVYFFVQRGAPGPNEYGPPPRK